MTQEVKQKRVDSLVNQFRSDAEKLNQAQIGTVQLVLVEGVSCMLLCLIRIRIIEKLYIYWFLGQKDSCITC